MTERHQYAVKTEQLCECGEDGALCMYTTQCVSALHTHTHLKDCTKLSEQTHKH